jgi:hypothetical protein
MKGEARAPRPSNQPLLGFRRDRQSAMKITARAPIANRKPAGELRAELVVEHCADKSGEEQPTMPDPHS